LTPTSHKPSLLHLSPANTCLKTLDRERERDVKDLMMAIKHVVACGAGSATVLPVACLSLSVNKAC